MGVLKWVLVVIVVIAVFAFFVPAFPTSQTSSDYFGVAQGQVSADVSLTFMASHCGSYVNAEYTQSYLGLQATHPISRGYNFVCNFQVTSTS